MGRLYRQLLATDDPILAELEGLGIEIRGLGPTFCKFCDYPDVDEWPAEKVPLPDLAPARKKLEQYIRHIRGLLETLPSDPGNDKLMPKYRLISQVARYTDLGTVAGLMAMLERFGEPGKTTVVQKNWPGGKAQALAELARWDDFAEEVAQPLVQTWREHRYEPILRAIMPARAAVRSSAARGRRPELPGPLDEGGRSACATSRRSGNTSASGSPTCWWTSSRTPTRSRPRSCCS